LIVRIINYLINFFREKKMNWYKLSQLNIIDNPRTRNPRFNWTKQIEQEQGWDRFLKRLGTPWKFVVEMDIGKPTEEEKQMIINKGLYDKEISKETIDLLKNIF